MGRPTTAAVALRGLCPRCGAMTLFAGLITFAPTCSACDLAIADHDVGDGPAAFVTAIGGGLVVILAVAVELSLAPALWVHAMLWGPLTLLVVLGGLRVTKAWLLTAEVRRGAREGRLR